MKPLAGLRLIDLSTVVAGPYSGALLADLGADVIKVEPPAGDAARGLVTEEGLAPHVHTNQRNKRGMVIDLKHPAGKAAFQDLVRWADVVLENYRPGVTERLGIEYPALATLNPRIIMCSITGYGLTGPGRDRAAFDANIQAYAGVMGLTGEPDGRPVRAALAYADLCAGMAGALGILAAVVARERTGRGQHVDLAMFDVQLSMQNYFCTMQLASARPPRRLGNEHELHVPYNAYPTASGPLFVTVVTEAQWSALLRALGRLDHPPAVRTHLQVLADARLRTRGNRIAARTAINAAMTAILATRPREEWMAALAAERLPFAPVNTLAEALADPQAAARGMLPRIPLPDGGVCPASGNPIKLSDAGPDTYTPPPTLGQHTREVLSDVLGYDKSRVARLLASGAFTAASERRVPEGNQACGGGGSGHNPADDAAVGARSGAASSADHALPGTPGAGAEEWPGAAPERAAVHRRDPDAGAGAATLHAAAHGAATGTGAVAPGATPPGAGD